LFVVLEHTSSNHATLSNIKRFTQQEVAEVFNALDNDWRQISILTIYQPDATHLIFHLNTGILADAIQRKRAGRVQALTISAWFISGR